MIPFRLQAVEHSSGVLPPSRMGQHVAIGMATKRIAATRLKERTETRRTQNLARSPDGKGKGETQAKVKQVAVRRPRKGSEKAVRRMRQGSHVCRHDRQARSLHRRTQQCTQLSGMDVSTRNGAGWAERSLQQQAPGRGCAEDRETCSS